MADSTKPEPLKIFISHSAADLEAARGVRRALRDAGLHVWLREEDLHEEDLELGATRSGAVDEAFRGSEVILFLVSSNSPTDQGQVENLIAAQAGNKKVVPAYLEPDPFSKATLIRKGFSTDFLKERRSELIDSAEGLARLIRGLHRLNRDKQECPPENPALANEPCAAGFECDASSSRTSVASRAWISPWPMGLAGSRFWATTPRASRPCCAASLWGCAMRPMPPR